MDDVFLWEEGGVEFGPSHASFVAEKILDAVFTVLHSLVLCKTSACPSQRRRQR